MMVTKSRSIAKHPPLACSGRQVWITSIKFQLFADVSRVQKSLEIGDGEILTHDAFCYICIELAVGENELKSVIFWGRFPCAACAR